MEYYKQSLSNAEEIGDRDGQGHAYCRLGSCYTHLQDLKEAIECYRQHLNIAEEIGDRKGEACAHSSLGRSFLICLLIDLQEDWHPKKAHKAMV